MSALVLKAVQNGYRTRFIRAQDLFDEMYASIADRSSRKLLMRVPAHDGHDSGMMADSVPTPSRTV